MKPMHLRPEGARSNLHGLKFLLSPKKQLRQCGPRSPKVRTAASKISPLPKQHLKRNSIYSPERHLERIRREWHFNRTLLRINPWLCGNLSLNVLFEWISSTRWSREMDRTLHLLASRSRAALAGLSRNCTWPHHALRGATAIWRVQSCGAVQIRTDTSPYASQSQTSVSSIICCISMCLATIPVYVILDNLLFLPCSNPMVVYNIYKWSQHKHIYRIGHL
jgi:hypothetical protein